MAGTIVDQLIEELQKKGLDELRTIGHQEQEQLSRDAERLDAIKRGDIPLTSPEGLKPISLEEMDKILEEAEKTVLIAGIVGAYRRRNEIAEQGKKLKIDWLERAVAHITVRDLLEGGFQSRRRSSRERRTDESQRPGWFRVDENCAGCGTRVIWTNYQQAPGEPVFCPACLGKKTTKSKTK